jgi:hypothetical protein
MRTYLQFKVCRRCHHAFSHDKEALILSTVQAIRLLTVATEPRESLAVGTESTKIWKATVRRDPPEAASQCLLHALWFHQGEWQIQREEGQHSLDPHHLVQDSLQQYQQEHKSRKRLLGLCNSLVISTCCSGLNSHSSIYIDTKYWLIK